METGINTTYELTEEKPLVFNHCFIVFNCLYHQKLE